MRTLHSPRFWTGLWLLQALIGAICLAAVMKFQVGDLRDLRVYVEAGKRVEAGTSAYITHTSNQGVLPYVYPPLLAGLFSTVARHELQNIAFVWNFLNLVALVLASALLASAITEAFHLSTLSNAISRACILFGVLVFPPTWLAWRLGQVHGILCFFLSAAMFAAARCRWVQFGGLIALASWLRCSPLPLLLVCLRRKVIWEALLGCVLATIGCISLGLWFHGLPGFQDFVFSNYLQLALTTLTKLENNIALPSNGLLGHLKIILLSVTGLMILKARRRAGLEPSDSLKQFCLIVIAIHLIAPILWIYHFVSLTPVFAYILIPRLASRNPRQFVLTYIAAFLAYLFMGGDLDYWRVNSSNVLMSDLYKIIENLSLAYLAIPVWFTQPPQKSFLP